MPLQKRISDGALLKFDSGPNIGSLMNDCCCCAPLPVNPTEPPLAASYAISGYFDGFFHNGGTEAYCGIPATSALPAWNGVFDGGVTYPSPGTIRWYVSAGKSYFGRNLNQIKSLPSDLGSWLEFNGVNWQFKLNVDNLFFSLPSGCEFYVGRKFCDLTPTGVYEISPFVNPTQTQFSTII